MVDFASDAEKDHESLTWLWCPNRDLLSFTYHIQLSSRLLCGTAPVLSHLIPWLNAEWIYTQDKRTHILTWRGSDVLLSLHPFLIQLLLPKHNRAWTIYTPIGTTWLLPTISEKGEPGILARGWHVQGCHGQVSSFLRGRLPNRHMVGTLAEQEHPKEMFTERILIKRKKVFARKTIT